MIKLNIRETNEYTREDRKGYNMSNSVAQPIIKQIDDNRDALDFFEKELLPKENEKTQRHYGCICDHLIFYDRNGIL